MSKQSKTLKKSTKSSNSDKTTKTENTKDVKSESAGNDGQKAAPVYRCKDVDFSNAQASELNKEGTQPLSYINYSDPVLNAETKILVQSGKFKVTGHGIPNLTDETSKGGNFYPDDSKREFIKIPLDPEQPACVELRKHFEEADEWAGSDEMRNQLFGKRADKYEYQPCVKTPEPRDNDDDDKKSSLKKFKKEYPIYSYIKMKFNMRQTGKERVNITRLKKVDGKTKNFVKAKTITDIANEIRFLSEVKIIFYYNKIWANKTPAQGAKKIMYGLGFKIIAIEYTPNVGKGLKSEDIDFLSEEEDGEETPTKEKSGAKFDDDDDDSKDDEDEDEKPSKKSKSKKPKKGRDEEEEEDEEEEDDKPQKKGKGKDKKPKKSSDDEEDEDEKDEDEQDGEDEEEDEDEPVVKKGKKANDKKASDKKSKKPKDDDDEEESEEREIKPKRKSKGKSSSKSR